MSANEYPALPEKTITLTGTEVAALCTIEPTQLN